MKKIFTLITLLIINIIGCNSKPKTPVVHTIVITDKKYDPSYTVLMTVPISNGKTITLQSIPQIIPEKWTITGKIISKWHKNENISIDIDKHRYDALKPNDTITYTEYL